MFYDKKAKMADLKLVIMIDGSCTSSGVIIGTLSDYSLIEGLNVHFPFQVYTIMIIVSLVHLKYFLCFRDRMCRMESNSSGT